MEIITLLIALPIFAGVILLAVGVRKLIDRRERLREPRPLLGVAEDTESLERRFERDDL